MNIDILPNFFILGVAKCGTTTLYQTLIRHPQIYLPEKKEINFFSFEENYAKGVDWYINSFFLPSSSFTARGESSPTYISRGKLVADRIKDLYQERSVRLVAIFRDPVKRAYSDYWHWVRNGMESLSFEDAIQAEKEWFETHSDRIMPPRDQRRYFYTGCYATHLRPFLNNFPRENFHFLLTEDLQKDFFKSICQLCEFLEVDPSVALPPITANPASMPRNKFLQRALIRPTRFQRILIQTIKNFLPTSLRAKMRNKLKQDNLRPFQYPSMNEEFGRELRIRYIPEILQLEEMIGRDLSHWERA